MSIKTQIHEWWALSPLQTICHQGDSQWIACEWWIHNQIKVPSIILITKLGDIIYLTCLIASMEIYKEMKSWKIKNNSNKIQRCAWVWVWAHKSKMINLMYWICLLSMINDRSNINFWFQFFLVIYICFRFFY